MNQGKKISKIPQKRAVPSLEKVERERQKRIFWYSEGYLDALKEYGIDNTNFKAKMQLENVEIQEVMAS